MYVVGREDDGDSFEGGSEVSDDGASWETVDDNDMDKLDVSTKVKFLIIISDGILSVEFFNLIFFTIIFRKVVLKILKILLMIMLKGKTTVVLYPKIIPGEMGRFLCPLQLLAMLLDWPQNFLVEVESN